MYPKRQEESFNQKANSGWRATNHEEGKNAIVYRARRKISDRDDLFVSVYFEAVLTAETASVERHRTVKDDSLRKLVEECREITHGQIVRDEA